MRIERTLKAVKRHLGRTFPGQFERYVKDPRGKRGRRWILNELLSGAMAGMLTGSRNCGEVEMLTERMNRRIPDTTLFDVLSKSSIHVRFHGCYLRCHEIDQERRAGKVESTDAKPVALHRDVFQDISQQPHP